DGRVARDGRDRRPRAGGVAPLDEGVAVGGDADLERRERRVVEPPRRRDVRNAGRDMVEHATILPTTGLARRSRAPRLAVSSRAPTEARRNGSYASSPAEIARFSSSSRRFDSPGSCAAEAGRPYAAATASSSSVELAQVAVRTLVDLVVELREPDLP